MGATITVRVNGIDETHEVETHQTLLSFLRDTLDLTGAKEGCNEGECGTCAVILEGKVVNACLVLAIEVDGRSVTTVEGLGNSRNLHPVQAAILKHHAIQCGFCAPGMVVTAAGFLAENPEPSEAEIKSALSGNMCRCTGYAQIVEAVREAAHEMRARGQTRRTP
jgi:carbon-monoxide dehydrogenase small subunit